MQEKAVSLETVAVFDGPKHKKGRSVRYCRTVQPKKAVPCRTVAIFSLKKPFRAILSQFSA
jgi:hypothetical protein